MYICILTISRLGQWQNGSTIWWAYVECIQFILQNIRHTYLSKRCVRCTHWNVCTLCNRWTIQIRYALHTFKHSYCIKHLNITIYASIHRWIDKFNVDVSILIRRRVAYIRENEVYFLINDIFENWSSTKMFFQTIFTLLMNRTFWLKFSFQRYIVDWKYPSFLT